jgi:hypothetical protein
VNPHVQWVNPATDPAVIDDPANDPAVIDDPANDPTVIDGCNGQ